MRPVVAQRHDSVTVKSTGCVFDPHSRRWNIYLNLYFHFIDLVSRLSARWELPLNTQCLQNSEENGERRVLTQGSLCLPCSVWDIAWSWFLIYLFNNKISFVVQMFILTVTQAYIPQLLQIWNFTIFNNPIENYKKNIALIKITRIDANIRSQYKFGHYSTHLSFKVLNEWLCQKQKQKQTVVC